MTITIRIQNWIVVGCTGYKKRWRVIPLAGSIWALFVRGTEHAKTICFCNVICRFLSTRWHSTKWNMVDDENEIWNFDKDSVTYNYKTFFIRFNQWNLVHSLTTIFIQERSRQYLSNYYQRYFYHYTHTSYAQVFDGIFIRKMTKELIFIHITFSTTTDCWCKGWRFFCNDRENLKSKLMM